MSFLDRFRKKPENTTELLRNPLAPQNNPATKRQPVSKPTAPLESPFTFDPNQNQSGTVIEPQLSQPSVKEVTPIHSQGFPGSASYNSDPDFYHHTADLFNIGDNVLSLVDPQFARNHALLPVSREGRTVTIVCGTRETVREVQPILKAKHPALNFVFKYQDLDLILECIETQYQEQHQDTVLSEVNEQAKSLLDLGRDYGDRTTNQDNFVTYKKNLTDDQSAHNVIAHSLGAAQKLGATDVHFTFFKLNDNAVMDTLEPQVMDFMRKRLNANEREFISVDGQLRLRERQGILVRARVDGEMELLHAQPMSLSYYRRIPQILKQQANLSITGNNDPQSGVYRTNLPNSSGGTSAVELRISIIPKGENDGDSITIRIQERNKTNLNLNNIGLLPSQFKLIYRAMDTTSGVTLFVGGIGTGKNTTLVSFTSAFYDRDPGRNIVILEDPPEINLPGVNQLPVLQSTKKEDREKGLRSFSFYEPAILRSDPNIVGIGEIRDQDAARALFQIARTGHMTFATLHATSAIDSIDRLRDLAIENRKIASALNYVVSQRLVRRLCTDCDRETITHQEIDDMDLTHIYRLIHVPDGKTPTFTRATGYKNGVLCKTCRGNGLRGRLAIIEILEVNRRIREMIAKDADSINIRSAAIASGFRTFWSIGLEHALLGHTTLSELKRHLPRFEADMEIVTDSDTTPTQELDNDLEN